MAGHEQIEKLRHRHVEIQESSTAAFNVYPICDTESLQQYVDY